MDFEQPSDWPQPTSPQPRQDAPPDPARQSTSIPPPYPPYPPYRPYEPRARRVSGWRILWGVLFGLSVLANIGLFLMLFGLAAFIATGQARAYDEVVLREGPSTKKIVVINVEGIMYDNLAEDIYRQLRTARRDGNVKGLIVRVNSPGGTISASDQVYQQIRRYRREQNTPVFAFMQSMAASGGYYASVACEQIIAEPTAITGSIGVIMSHFVFGELLEDKLGILPVHLTMGDKKDWPSSFRAPDEQELQYMRDRLLKPAYDRFVEVVTEGRKDVLSPGEVLQLADGSIFVAPQALEAKLIDKVGYLDDAVEALKRKIGIDAAQVVEYRRPFSWMGLLSAKSQGRFRLDRTTLHELGTPEVLYLWSAAPRGM